MVLLSKLLNLLAQPLHLVLLLMLASLWLGRRRPRAARRVLLAATLLLVLLGARPLPDALLGWLEAQTPEPAPDADLRSYAGLVVLGGAMEPGRISAQHTQPLLNGSAERMTMAYALWRRNPALQIVFTGGEGEWLGSGPSEAARAEGFFASMGVPAAKLTLESRSQNTYENARFTRELPGLDAQKPWLLVTSAWHMPRALAVFQKAGWNVQPYPVDYRGGANTPWSQYSLRESVDQWETGLHELIGIAVYRLLGRS